MSNKKIMLIVNNGKDFPDIYYHEHFVEWLYEEFYGMHSNMPPTKLEELVKEYKTLKTQENECNY